MTRRFYMRLWWLAIRGMQATDHHTPMRPDGSLTAWCHWNRRFSDAASWASAKAGCPR